MYGFLLDGDKPLTEEFKKAVRKREAELGYYDIYDELYEVKDKVQDKPEKSKTPDVVHEKKGEYFSIYKNGITECKEKESFENQKKCRGFVLPSFQNKCLYLLDEKQCMCFAAKDYMHEQNKKNA